MSCIRFVVKWLGDEAPHSFSVFAPSRSRMSMPASTGISQGAGQSMQSRQRRLPARPLVQMQRSLRPCSGSSRGVVSSMRAAGLLAQDIAYFASHETYNLYS